MEVRLSGNWSPRDIDWYLICREEGEGGGGSVEGSVAAAASGMTLGKLELLPIAGDFGGDDAGV